jgi:hypothetical protein
MRRSLEREWFARLELLVGHALPERRYRGTEGDEAFASLHYESKA